MKTRPVKVDSRRPAEGRGGADPALDQHAGQAGGKPEPADGFLTQHTSRRNPKFLGGQRLRFQAGDAYGVVPELAYTITYAGKLL